MGASQRMEDSIRAALAREPRIGLEHHPISIEVEDGVLTLDGEVETVAAKKLALEQAAGVRGVVGIVDRLRVAPATPMGDGEIARRLGEALCAEGAFARYGLEGGAEGKPPVLLRDPDPADGTIDFVVEDGVVALNGDVVSLEHKRLAGVLAWWVPGTCDVTNGILVEPLEEDSPDRLADTVRLVLEKDPALAADRVRVQADGDTVYLSGMVRSAAEKDLAERDVWYVFGVDLVINDLEVVP